MARDGETGPAVHPADAKRKPLKVSQSDGKLLVALPEKAPGEFATVVCLETMNR